MRVDSMERCPAWACTASSAMPASRSRVRHVWRSSWHVAWTRPAGSLQDDKDPVRCRLGGAFGVQIAGDTGEEPGRDRHQPLMAALAIGDEHPPLDRAQILQPQAKHLAAAQPTEHHRFDHGPVPPATIVNHEKNPAPAAPRRLIVRADSPDSPSARRTTLPSPTGRRCAAMNSSTSLAETPTGGLSITEKNTPRSDRAAATVFGRHRAATKSR